jgi:hygromycin-B 4-O-kinase
VSGLSVVARQGEWSRAFTFERDGVGYILRFSAYREDFDKDLSAWRIAGTRLPVPKVVELGEAFEAYYAVTERLSGTYLDVLDEPGMRRVLPSLFETLDVLRSLAIPPDGGFGVWSSDGHAPHATWRDALLDAGIDRPTRLGPSRRDALAVSPIGTNVFDEVFARMASLAQSCPEQRNVIHADLLNFNVFVAGERITGLIDWGSSMFGDFLYDLAWLTFWWPWFPQWSTVDIAADARRHLASLGLDVPSLSQRLRCYELHIGLEGMYYSAGRRDWTHLEGTARRALELSRRPLG